MTTVCGSPDQLMDLQAAIGLSGTDEDHQARGYEFSQDLLVTTDLILGTELMDTDWFRDAAWTLEVTTVMVVRPCYLTLRKQLHVTPDILVVIVEPGRLLGVDDCSRAIVPRIGTIEVPWDPGVARAVDAGLVQCRLPATLRQAATAIYEMAGYEEESDD